MSESSSLPSLQTGEELGVRRSKDRLSFGIWLSNSEHVTRIYICILHSIHIHIHIYIYIYIYTYIVYIYSIHI